MDELYSGYGIRFRYPRDWQVTEQPQPGEVTITVASPETSFWSITLYSDRPDCRRVLQTALDAFREEYGNVDVYELRQTSGRFPTLARDLDFVCLELINSAFLRVFQTSQFTALVLYQGTDHELDATRPVLEAISDSLECLA